MARALSNIRDDVRQLIGQPDSSNSNFSDAQLTNWINEGYRKIVTEIEVSPVTNRDYDISGATISLNANFLSITVIKILAGGTQWKNLIVGDLVDLANLDADWENATTGEPTHAIKQDHFTLRLYPPPDSSNDSQTNGVRVFGTELPSNLSSDTDTTTLPHHLDDALPHYAAYYALSRLGQEEKAMMELRLFKAAIKEGRKLATQWSRGRRRWTWMESDQSDYGSVDIE